MVELFPAGAGMNRRPQQDDRRNLWLFPAGAGMNRRCEMGFLEVRSLFPAGAGMNRRILQRGDSQSFQRACSPQARG